MFIFRESTDDDISLFQKWNEASAVNRWIAIDNWNAYYRAVSKQENYFLHSIFQDEELVAFIAAEVDDGKAALLLIVSPDRHGKGIGTTVLQLFMEQHRFLIGNVSALCAGIFPENFASIRCFEKAGFQKTSIGNDGEMMYTYTFGG